MMNDSTSRQIQVEIRVNGRLDSHWHDWFDDLSVQPLGTDQTILTGQLPDQAALHGVLRKVNNLGLILVSLTTEAA